MIAQEDFLEEVDKFMGNLAGRCCLIRDRKFAVVGDIHADFRSLNYILSKIEDRIVFLGDYADRGNKPVETYYALLKRANKDGSVLLRGNHESDLAIPHELPIQLNEYFGDDEVYRRLNKMWERLPVSAMSRDLWFVHGGVPTKSGKIDVGGIKADEVLNPTKEAMLEMMWNDPWEEERCGYSFRGIGMLFGKKATRELLNALNVKVVVRSHEPIKILKVEQNGMVVTVGSCMEPYNLSKAAFLRVDQTREIKNGYEVVEEFGVIFRF
ncbi:hypothetical protein DRP05_14775 [Archaeoglobales archaeon]|nr:MAG: hypothetical protein DRP05_14775 [Archaeoglobales archaeon]